MRSSLVAALAVLLIATASLAYLGGSANRPPVASTISRTSTEFSTVSTTETVTTSVTVTRTTTLSSATLPGLELLLDINPSLMASGENLSVNMALYNPLSTNYTITVGVWNVSVCPGSFPFGLDIFQGHYDFSNLSSAVPLALDNFTFPFPCFVGFNSTLDFGPHSDSAVDSNFLGTDYHQVNYTIVYSGYYVPTNSTDGSGMLVYKHHDFPPGQYTVKLFDQWDQTLLAYFRVT